jgi:hypothetical protein
MGGTPIKGNPGGGQKKQASTTLVKLLAFCLLLQAGLYQQLVFRSSSACEDDRSGSAVFGPGPRPALKKEGAPRSEDDDKPTGDDDEAATTPGDFQAAPRVAGRQYRQSSKDATVMAMAQGYDLLTHRRFVGSLRKSGFQGNM